MGTRSSAPDMTTARCLLLSLALVLVNDGRMRGRHYMNFAPPRRFLKISKRYPSEDYEPVQLVEGVPPSPFFNEDPDLNTFEDFHFVRRSAEPRNNVDKREAEEYYNNWISSHVGK